MYKPWAGKLLSFSPQGSWLALPEEKKSVVWFVSCFFLCSSFKNNPLRKAADYSFRTEWSEVCSGTLMGLKSQSGSCKGFPFSSQKNAVVSRTGQFPTWPVFSRACCTHAAILYGISFPPHSLPEKSTD